MSENCGTAVIGVTPFGWRSTRASVFTNVGRSTGVFIVGGITFIYFARTRITLYRQ